MGVTIRSQGVDALLVLSPAREGVITSLYRYLNLYLYLCLCLCLYLICICICIARHWLPQDSDRFKDSGCSDSKTATASKACSLSASPVLLMHVTVM